MSLFFDTSALLKLYVDEPGSEDVKALARAEGPVHIAFLAPHEFLCAIRRKAREGVLSSAMADEIWSAFRVWLSGDFPIISYSPAVSDRALLLLDRQAAGGLRTLDSLQLACAAEVGGEFVSADRRLDALARAAGLRSRLVG